MDDRAFDRLAKGFATRRSRRALIRSMLGLGGAAVVSAAVDGPATAQVVGPPPGITPVPICPLARICGADCCGITETCCNGVCCTAAEQCCDPPGPAAPICLPDDACCRRSDCKHLDDPANCTLGICNQQTHACETLDGCAAKGLTCCPGDRRGFCYDPATQCCPKCERGSCLTCVDGQCAGCEKPEICCVLGDLETCLDLTIEGACCTAGDCGLEDPATCQVSVCRDFVCEPASECLDGVEQCCGNHLCIPLGDTCPCNEQNPCPDGEDCCADGVCRSTCGALCTGDSQCGPCESCPDGICQSTCVDPQTCCAIGDFEGCLDLTVEGACCTADTCGLEDAATCTVSACIDFACRPVSECLPDVEQCCGNHTCIDANDPCS